MEELTGQAFDWHDLVTRRQEEIVRDLAGEGQMIGVVEFLEKRRQQGVRAAVVSSSSHHWVDGWLEKLGLGHWFETVVCRGDAPRIKPAPDLYLEAVRRLGVEPGDCLVIEDSLNGIKAARAAGIDVWAVPNRVTACLDFSLAGAVFPSLEQIAQEF